MANSFDRGFALGQQAWMDAQRLRLLEEQERRAQESHDAAMARERDAAEERGLTRQYRSELANVRETDTSAAAKSVGLKAGSQQERMLADQTAGFGDEGALATIQAAAPAAGLRPDQIAPIQRRSGMDTALERRDIADRYGRVQDAAAYDQRFLAEHQRWNADVQRMIGTDLQTLRDDLSPDELKKLLARWSGLVDSTGYARGAFAIDGDRVMPLISADGKLFNAEGGAIPLNAAGVRALGEQMMQLAADPSKLAALRMLQQQETRAEQLHGFALDKAAREQFVGQRTLPAQIEAPYLKNEETRAGIGLKGAQSRYYDTAGRVALDRESRLSAQESEANNYFPPQALVEEKTGRVSYVQLPKRAGLQPRVSPMPEGFRQPRDISADLTVAASIAKETGVPIGVALKQVESARSGYDPDTVLTERLRKLNEEAAAARAKQVQGSEGGGMRIPKSSAQVQREQAAAAQQTEQSKQLMRLTDEWIETAATLDLSTLRPKDALRLRAKYWSVMTPEERAAITRRAQ